MNNTPPISIIVPVYNTESFLDKCVDSILAQNYTNFELLLIDDGSTDNSGAICDNYAALDSRVRVFHKENGGVSSARNVGLRNATGQWICFVDSDDWVGKSYLDMIESISDEVEIIHFGFREEYPNGEIKSVCEFNNQRKISHIDFFSSNIYSSCSVSYFFSFSLLNEIFFNETIKYSEDREFIIKCVLRSTKMIQLVHNTDYVYSYNPNSATRKKRSDLHCTDDLVVLKNIGEYILKNNISISQESKKFIVDLLLKSFFLVYSTVDTNYCKMNKFTKNEVKYICSLFGVSSLYCALYFFCPYSIIITYRLYWYIHTVYHKYIK